MFKRFGETVDEKEEHMMLECHKAQKAVGDCMEFPHGGEENLGYAIRRYQHEKQAECYASRHADHNMEHGALFFSGFADSSFNESSMPLRAAGPRVVGHVSRV